MIQAFKKDSLSDDGLYGCLDVSRESRLFDD